MRRRIRRTRRDEEEDQDQEDEGQNIHDCLQLPQIKSLLLLL